VGPPPPARCPVWCRAAWRPPLFLWGGRHPPQGASLPPSPPARGAGRVRPRARGPPAGGPPAAAAAVAHPCAARPAGHIGRLSSRAGRRDVRLRRTAASPHPRPDLHPRRPVRPLLRRADPRTLPCSRARCATPPPSVLLTRLR